MPEQPRSTEYPEPANEQESPAPDSSTNNMQELFDEAQREKLPEPGQIVELTSDEGVLAKWHVLESNPSSETFTAQALADSETAEPVIKTFHLSQLRLSRMDAEHINRITQPQGPIGDILDTPPSSANNEPPPKGVNIREALNGKNTRQGDIK